MCVCAKNCKENSVASGLGITCEKDYRKDQREFIHPFHWFLVIFGILVFFILLFDLVVWYFSYILSVVLQKHSQW